MINKGIEGMYYLISHI